MKAFLLHRDRDFDLERPLPANESDLCRDLELDTLFETMAANDALVFDVAKKAILAAPSNDIATIKYRQDALKDCLSNPDAVRQLYGLAGEAFLRLKKVWPRFREYPTGLLDNSVSRMQVLMEVLKQVRGSGRPALGRFPVGGVLEPVRDARARARRRLFQADRQTTETLEVP